AYMANDIMAAKRALDRRNDPGECNSANIVLIGAESGATLGALWAWYEWHRPKYNVGFPLQPTNRSQVEGQDIACAVWLSISPTLGTGRSPWKVPVESWLRSPVREKVPM